MTNTMTLKDTVPQGAELSKMERLTRFLESISGKEFKRLEVVDPELEENVAEG